MVNAWDRLCVGDKCSHMPQLSQAVPAAMSQVCRRHMRTRLYATPRFINHDGDGEDNVGQKRNLYFTYESRDTLKSFSLFPTVKITSKLNMEHSVKFGI